MSNIKGEYEIKTLEDILPGAFGPNDLQEINRIDVSKRK